MPDDCSGNSLYGNVCALFEAVFSTAVDYGRQLRQPRLMRRVLVTAVALLMTALLMLAACQTNGTTGTAGSGTGSSGVTGATSEPTVRPNYLGSFMLAQRVAESINRQSEIGSLFQSIPEPQRQGLLLDEYVQYVRLLRRMVTGNVTSLTRIGDQELAGILKGLRFSAELKHEGFYFQAGTAAEPSQRLAFFQQVDVDGTPYLARTPIVRVLSLQNYAALYFDAIDRSDRDALAVLIRSSADTLEARLQKADRIVSFYHSQVTTASPSFRVAMVMPDRITFAQGVYENASRTKVGTRTMTIYADGAAGFIIDDPIPDTLAKTELTLTSAGKTILDFSRLVNGQLPTLTSSQMGEIAGAPILHNDTTCTPLPNGERQMAAYYNGIIVEGVGRCDQHKYWRVRVTRITLTDGRFLTASGLGIGKSLNDLLMKYPFADETGGVVNGTLDKYSLKLQFGLENRQISRITLTIDGD